MRQVMRWIIRWIIRWAMVNNAGDRRAWYGPAGRHLKLAADSLGVRPHVAEAVAPLGVAVGQAHAVVGNGHSQAVRLAVSFQKMSLCQRDSIALVWVLPRYAFIVEGATCEDEWDAYEDLMMEAVESFALSPVLGVKGRHYERRKFCTWLHEMVCRKKSSTLWYSCRC